MRRIRVDLSSATQKVAVIDNNDGHTRPVTGDVYRLTTAAHNQESGGTLEAKVDQMLALTGNIKDGEAVTVEVVTTSGTKEMSLTRAGYSLWVTEIGSTDSQAVEVHIPRPLFKVNPYGNCADIWRAVLMVAISRTDLKFQPSRNEERGFRKLKKSLCL